MGIQQDALFGDDGIRTMGATMVNPYAASSDTDWGAILANGIRGAAQGAIGSMTQGAYTSGQLQAYQVQQQQRTNSMLTLILIGGVIYLLAARGN